MHGLSLVVASRGYFCCRTQVLEAKATVVMADRLGCPVACGIFPDQGSNPCSLRVLEDSQPLDHQRTLCLGFLSVKLTWDKRKERSFICLFTNHFLRENKCG